MTGIAIPGASVAFKLIAASYAVDKTWLDVTEAMRKEITNPASR